MCVLHVYTCQYLPRCVLVLDNGHDGSALTRSADPLGVEPAPKYQTREKPWRRVMMAFVAGANGPERWK